MNALARALDELQANTQQWAAFQAPSPAVVLAPPGSGKTKLLTTRVAHDLVTRIPEPHGAAVITMTNSAAEELRRRLSALGTRHRSNLFVGTVHSFALNCILRSYGKLAGMGELANAEIADNSTIREVLATATSEIFDPGENPFDLKTTFDRRRGLMNYDEDVVELGGPRFAHLAVRYEELLHKKGLVDFADVVRYSVELVEANEFVRRALVARFSSLYVDEYQDLAPGLDRLVRAVCFDESANAELFAVGDPDQAIFAFTGTAPHLLLELSERATVTETRLRLNYRATEELISASIKHLGEERDVDGRSTGGSIQAVECKEGFPQQCQYAVELAKETRAKSQALDEFAVLTRTGEQSDQAAQAMRNADVPVFVRADRGFRSTPTSLLLEAMAAWATQPRSREGIQLVDVLRRLSGLVHTDHGLRKRCVEFLIDFGMRPEDPASKFVDEALDSLNLIPRLERSGRDDDLHELENLRLALAEGSLEGLSTYEFGMRARAPGRVLVTTIHSSKGLEFDTVVVVDVDEGSMPFWAAKGAQLDEERRKFYVAITRARKAVYCLWTGWRDTKTGRRFDGPSRYLRDLELV